MSRKAQSFMLKKINFVKLFLDNTTIEIRGFWRIEYNDPLVLSDGIEYSLIDVDPNDI